MKPACMDDTEYAAWQDADRIVPAPDRATSPCRDCTPLWHADMVAGGMCDGVPGSCGHPPSVDGERPRHSMVSSPRIGSAP